ncbi:MAG: imidazole glycerol phosphate synthase subunit HisH [Planctomycetota bacterium]
MSDVSGDRAARPQVAVLDYRMGNLRSMKTSLERAGAEVRIVTGPEGMEGIDGLVMPGVGAFAPAMRNLAEQGLEGPVLEWARADRPFLAVCVGMQLLFEESEERERGADVTPRGLGLVRGRVARLPEGATIPEMGWNTIRRAAPAAHSPYGDALVDGGYYYFAHSYCAHAADPGFVLATTDYGVEYASVVGRGRMIGTQFHPEKSADVGARVLKRFVEVATGAREVSA